MKWSKGGENKWGPRAFSGPYAIYHYPGTLVFIARCGEHSLSIYGYKDLAAAKAACEAHEKDNKP